MRTLTLCTLVLVVAGCSEKKVESTVGAAVAESTRADVPADAASQAFAAVLMKNPLESFSPDDGGGASFKWSKLTFSSGNTWEAASVLSADGENIDCVESGKWSMDAAESASRATVQLQTESSNCPGRPGNKAYRLQMSREGSGWQVLFR